MTAVTMDARELYGLPLERFTAERNALANQLRQAGRREQAQAVARLRKPSVAAWAVNQLVRTQHEAIRSLFEAGDALRAAHADVVGGRGSARTLREAVEAERRSLERLTEIAGGLMSADGQELTRATLEHVTETLHAAALDEDARAQVRDGCLERALRHVGLGSVAPGAAAAPGAEPARRTASDGEAETIRARERQRARQAELSAARRSESQARQRAERAERDLGAAQARRERAAEALREADEALSAARLLAETAALEHRQARERREGLEG